MYAECLLLAVSYSFCLAQNTSTEIHLNRTSYSYIEPMFGKCPDAYQHYCFFGTCRYLISEEKPACVCYHGYVGSRCESVNLLQMMSENPHSTIALAFSVTVLVFLSLILTVSLGVYFCRNRKPISQLTLLENSEV